MESALVTLLAALLGGLITLATVMLTQRGARALQAQEQQRSDRLRAEDQNKERQLLLFAERRAAYARLSAATRTVRDVLDDASHALTDSRRIDDRTRARLEQSWQAYIVQHAEAQMIVSDEVLVQLGPVNGSLHILYGMASRLDEGVTPREGDSPSALRTRLDGLWERLERLRDAMRSDLGVTGSTATP